MTAAPAAGTSGRRILVAEDNQLDQMVAVGLLESAGYAPDVVGDGRQAVLAAAPGHEYVAVLMDCRMPRLDGFDATRAIRAQETVGQRVPIIAMTASGLEGEEDRCRSAGMDDFLTKPVDPVRLVRVVRQWAGDVTPVPAAAMPTHPSRPARVETAVVDLDRMRMLDEMRRDGTSLFDRAAANFGQHAPTALAAIRAAVAAEDPDALVAAAHRLKGSATNLGLPALGEAAGALEALGDTGTTHDADPLLAALHAALDRATAALEDLRSRGL